MLSINYSRTEKRWMYNCNQFTIHRMLEKYDHAAYC